MAANESNVSATEFEQSITVAASADSIFDFIADALQIHRSHTEVIFYTFHTSSKSTNRVIVRIHGMDIFAA
jgi:hypothetical protein